MLELTDFTETITRKILIQDVRALIRNKVQGKITQFSHNFITASNSFFEFSKA